MHVYIYIMRDHSHTCFHVSHPWQEVFIRKYSVKHERSKEMSLEVDFEFLTKQQMAEDYGMTERSS